ncbi:unnamed protein product [Lactuca saligna]|uniref:Uncharacterized protein n=1 Tax=Lactuca saligna TaxID=75948 RepID=A0AA35Z229_LACSI|nr:unnamed protein product [Lactuca saligna]
MKSNISLRLMTDNEEDEVPPTHDGTGGEGKMARRRLILVLMGRLIATREIVGGYNVVVDHGTGTMRKGEPVKLGEQQHRCRWCVWQWSSTGRRAGVMGVFGVVVCSTITGIHEKNKNALVFLAGNECRREEQGYVLIVLVYQ